MGRLRFNPQATTILAEHPEYVLGCEQRIQPNGSRPLNLEIGMGKGGFLYQMAQRTPQEDFVGIERYPTIMVKALGKWLKGIRIGNLKMVVGDAENLVQLLPPHSVHQIFLNFSDPWPKKRHAHRRLLHPNFLRLYAQILQPTGEVIFKTDNAPFFQWVLEEVVPNYPMEVLEINNDLPDTPDNIQTEYEQKFRRLGTPIHRLIFRPKID